MTLTSLLMAVSMALLGTNLIFHKQILAYYSNYTSWLQLAPLVWICTYCVGYVWGPGTLIWVLMGEMCPTKIRGLTSGLAVTMAYVATTISTYATNFVIVTFGMGKTSLGFAVICALNVLFAFAYLPETKDKSETEKDEYYIGGIK